MQTRARGDNAIWIIGVHTNEGPEGNHSAAGLANYLKQIDGGYHKVTDSLEVVTTAGDDQIVWGASGANTHGLHICFIGFANQTVQQWNDAYSRGELNLAALVVAGWCLKYGIPVLRLTPQQVAAQSPTNKGLAGHRDIELSGLPGTGGQTGHYDPGPNFPWQKFLQLVRDAIDPPEAKEWDVKLNTKVRCIANKRGGLYYVQADGGVVTAGDAPFFGSVPGLPTYTAPVIGKNHFVSICLNPEQDGYWIASRNGYIYTFGEDNPKSKIFYPGNFAAEINDAAGQYLVDIVPSGDPAIGIKGTRGGPNKSDQALLTPRK